MIIPIGDVTDGKAPVFVEKKIVLVINLFALCCDKYIWVTMILNSNLIVETERSKGGNRAVS